MVKLQLNKKRAVYFCDSCIDNDYLYFVSIFHDGFFSFDLKKNEIKYLGDSGMDDENSNLNVKVKKIDHSIFSVPNFGKCLFEYNLETKTLHRHVLHIDKNKNEPLRRAFQNIYKFDDKYYLVPKSYPAIVEIDLSTDRIISEYGDWVEALSNIDRLWLVDEVIVGTSIYMVQAWSNIILEYNLIEHQYAIHHLGEDDDEFSLIKYDGKIFWLFCRKELKILQWDKDRDSVNIFNSFSKEIRNAMIGELEHESIDDILSSVHMDSGFVYLVSSLRPVVLQINRKNMNCDLIFLRDIIMPKHMEWVVPFCINRVDEEHIYCMVSDGRLLIYDKMWRKISDIWISESFEYGHVIQKHLYRALSEGKILDETDLRWAGQDIQDVLPEILTWAPQSVSKGTRNCGNEIYRSICSMSDEE